MKKAKDNLNQKVNKRKKISFFAAMLIVISGSNGAGIYFRSESILNNSHQSLILAIFCWIFGALAIIAMALALVEITSAKSHNLSLIGWNHTFNNRHVFNMSKNFMTYLYLPLSYFLMPLYALMSLQQGLGAILNQEAFVIGTKYDWMIWTGISLLIVIYFSIVPALYTKAGDIQNKIMLAIKFLPLFFIIIIGFVLAFSSKGGVNQTQWNLQDQHFDIRLGSSIASYKSLGAGFGVFLSVSAIFFVYDGFYISAGIQSEMKEPQKTPLALLFGLLITTIIYLLIAISMSINGGSFVKMKDYLSNWWGSKAGRIIFGILNICIAIGILGIINNLAMWLPRYIEDLLALGELPFWYKLRFKLNKEKPKIGVIYSLFLCIPLIILFSVFGALGYFSNENYNIFNSLNSDKTIKSDALNKLYNFTDLVANWTALIVYTLIAMAILGGIKNRKHNFVKVQKKKYFLVSAYFIVIVTYLSVIITTIIPFIDLFLLIGFDKEYFKTVELAKFAKDNTYIIRNENAFFNQLLAGRILCVVTLIIYLLISILPSVFEKIYFKKMFKSWDLYLAWKQETLEKGIVVQK